MRSPSSKVRSLTTCKHRDDQLLRERVLHFLVERVMLTLWRDSQSRGRDIEAVNTPSIQHHRGRAILQAVPTFDPVVLHLI